MKMEKSLVIIKPDAVNRDLAGEIISRFEKRGLKLAAMKMEHLGEKTLHKHYAHHREKPFFKSLVKFMSSIPSILVVVEGIDAVAVTRKIVGPTNSRDAEPGTIRGDYSMSLQQNMIHASDSIETAKKEIERFFTKEELMKYKKISHEAVYGEEERE